MNAKHLLCFLLVVTVSAVGQAIPDGSAQGNPDEIPEPVQKLLIWPTSDTITHKSLSVTSTNVQNAIYTSSSWVRKTIDSKWLPEKLDPLCVSKEFEERDVVRFKWTNEGRSFKVAQTVNIFVVEISPAPEGQLHAIRGVALDIFVKTGRRLTPQGDRVEIPELNQAIVKSSFDARPAKRITVEDSGAVILVGRAKTWDEMVTAWLIEETGKNGGKDGTGGIALPHWYEHVCWFADDKRVVFYFLKAEAGPQPQSYYSKADSRWFK